VLIPVNAAGRLAIAFVLAGVLAGCGGTAPAPGDLEGPTRLEVWEAIVPQAERYLLDPAFVYALVAAESNFDPAARNGQARGLMQIKPAAWRSVTEVPYESAVWDWRQNLRVGIDYLALCRSTIHREATFSYPLMLAAFHYGIDHVARRGFDLRRIPPPENDIYRRLWSGDLAPVPPPVSESGKSQQADTQ
jgi:soluble lytic murein transglycosylase-like protein